MKKLLFLLAAMLVSLSFVNVAEARPKYKRYHYSNVHKHTNKVTVQPKVERKIYNDDDSSPASFFARDKERMNVVLASKQLTMATFERTERAFQSGGDLIAKAYNHMGASAKQLGLPNRLWCADFMNMIAGGDDRRAISYAQRGKAAPYGCTNCVAVTARKGGGHVGVVSGYDSGGNPIIISGNHNRRVGVGVYAKHRVIAYRYI